MRKSAKCSRGQCSKREIRVKAYQVCDWFEAKRKGRYKTRCGNCSHYKVEPEESKVGGD